MKHKNSEKFLLFLRVMEYLQLDPTEQISINSLKERANEALKKFRSKYPIEAGHPEVAKEEQYVIASHIYAKLITVEELIEANQLAKQALKKGIIQKRKTNKEWELDKEFLEKDYLDFVNRK